MTAQTILGRVTDESSGSAIADVTIVLLDSARTRVSMAISASSGHFSLNVPRLGPYYITAQRIGYQRLESPLLAIAEVQSHQVDLVMSAAPIGLDPMTVTVANQQVDSWLRIRLRGSPHRRFGFQVARGSELEALKEKSDDNTELLRLMWVPVAHGRRVCLFSPIDGCGRLYIDNKWTPNEHIDSVDLSDIATVVTFLRPPEVWLFTKGFDWSRRPQG